MRKLLLPLAFFMATTSGIAAETAKETDDPVRYKRWDIAYDVNADGSYTETQRRSTTVLKDNALEGYKSSSMTFSKSVSSGEVLEAYTLKKSGERIDAPKSSYQITDKNGMGKESPLYSDETTISVVYPDLAVGDTSVFAFRIKTTEGMFPGHFSCAQGFSPFVAYDDVHIRITAPKEFPLRTKSYFLHEKAPVVKDDRQILEWTYQNKTPQKWTPADDGVFTVGDEPSLFVSTFDSYKQIAQAYGARATPKAVPTERVKALAAKITDGSASTDDRVRALYDWVGKNLSYGGNCIGIGAVVPRDLDVVLDNKIGDCKDHATLLQALLAAQGIESEQALVNAGAAYGLPEVPVVSAINHVISYVPEMKLFLDATSSVTPYGMIPIGIAEKPVLLVTNFVDGLKTPSIAQYGHEQVMKTRLLVKPDGTAAGETTIELGGVFAIKARDDFRGYREDQEQTVVRSFLASQGLHGTGTLQRDDPTARLDRYRFSVSYDIQDLTNAASTIGLQIAPVVYSYHPIALLLGDAYEPTPKKDTGCLGGRSVEEYLFEFPSAETVVGFPKDFTYTSPILDYKATYRKTGKTLAVTRELKDKTATHVCSPEFVENHRRSAREILRDVRSQILINNEAVSE